MCFVILVIIRTDTFLSFTWFIGPKDEEEDNEEGKNKQENWVVH
jgi:hypothetical protein